MKSSFMDRVNLFIEKINGSTLINSLMRGMVIAMPAIMGGSFATILMNLNIGGYQEFIRSTGIHSVLNAITIVTINFTALYTVFGIAVIVTIIVDQFSIDYRLKKGPLFLYDIHR